MSAVLRSRMFLFRILSFVIVSFFLLNAVFYWLQPGMLFYPLKQLDATPNDWGLQYEDVALKTSDNIQLHGWFVPVENSKKVVLFFHGNGGNISHRGESIMIFNQLGLNVFIIDYRGYGLSEGEITEQGLYNDAMSAWQYLTQQRGYKKSDVIVFGRSLGGAVATQLASLVKPRALILESTFTSVRDMANKVLPVVANFIYLRFNFDTEKRIRQVTVPVLVMHSPDDDIVPFALGKRVFAAANEEKEFYKLRGNHNNGFIESMPSYQKVIRRFIIQ